MSSSFALELLSVGDRAHGDLELRLGVAVHRCDSYYLALDEALAPRDEGRAKARRVLATLLRGVARGVQRGRAGSVVLLPYDFSDEYVGLLRLSLKAQGRVHLTRVTSLVAGWATTPSHCWKASAKQWGPLQPWPFLQGVEEPFVMSTTELLDGLTWSMARALRYTRPRRLSRLA